MFARVCLAVLGGRRLRRRASPLSEPDLLEAIRAQLARLGLRIAPSVAWCDRVLVPVVIGIIRPAILLPASLATGLTPGQLQLVIAHELAHLYRWDHIVLVFQRVVEAVFFFHPAVWYISRRLSVERELCCDELVLRAGSNAGEYAESLLRVAELSRPAATAAPLVAIAMARGGRGSRALVQRLSRILGQPECSPVRLVNPWPLAVGLAVCLGAALICGSAGNLRVLAQADSAKGNTPRANENGADDTTVDLAVEKNAVAALRAMQVRTAGDLNTTPLGTVEFWDVPAEAWQHIGRLSSLRELRIVASDVRGRPFEQIGGLKNLRRLTVINSKCSPTDLAQVGGLRNLEHLDIAFTVFDENDTWRSGQLGQLTPGEREQIDRYLASRPAGQAEQYRRMIEVAVLTDRALQHLRGLKRLRTMKLINTNITGSGLDCLKDLPALEELDLPLIAFSADVARVLGGIQSLRRFRYADVTDECLAEIARLSRLEELELFGDGVTDRGAEHLRRLVKLRKLSIRGSQMTDGGLRQLADLPHLQYLDLRFSVGALSEAGVTGFRAQKPGCQVLFQATAKEDSTPPNRPVATQDKEDAAKKTVALTVRIARAADATTKAAVKSFTIVPASYEERAKHVTWQSQYRKRYTGTPAEFRMERPWEATVLRIEADGYVPILTRPFRRDEGQVNVDLTFTPDPGRTGKVVTPSGEPAAGASLALCTWTNEVNVQGGRLSYAGHGRELGKLNTSAADGTFRIPSEPDPSVLVVAHDSGYAEVIAVTSSTIHLKPWGRIEGECVVNGKPIADQAIHIGAGRGDVEVNLHYSDDVATDAAGRFGVDRVPPVALYVQPWFKHGESAFSLLWFSGRTAIAAGQTTRITLPRVGRPLMGRVSLPAESGLRLADLTVEAELSLRPPSMSMRSGDELNREYAAYQAFLKSDLGHAFRREGIAVNADGTFRIEGLPEAHYVLYVTAYGKPAGPGGDRGPALARLVRRVEVPPLADSEEPLDLGNGVLREIETTPAKPPLAPAPERSSEPRQPSPDSKKDSRSSAAAIPVPDAQPPASEPKPDQAKERERLQGTWAVTKVTVNGNVVTDPDLSGATVVFQENELAVKKGDRTMERFALRMDSTADPKAFHATRVEPKSPEQSGWMIYALTGDTLQIGFCNALKVRPAGFEPREDLVVLGLSRAAAIPKPKKSESAPGKAPLEGTVLEVLPDGMIKVSLGTDNGLRLGDVLHVWRPAQGGAVQLLADVIVRVAEKTFAKCLVLQLLGPADAPVRKGDAVSRWLPEPTRRRSRGKMPTMEGQVVSVTPAQEVGISLGSDDGLKVGDTLHVRRQAPDGSSRSLAIIVVKAIEPTAATCALLHELADPPPHLPLDKGDIAARWCPVGKVLSVQGDVVEISLSKDARLTRGERIFVCRDSTPGTKEQVTELTVDTIGDKSTTCKIRPGLDKGERWPVRVGDWAIPHRTEFFNLDYGGAEEKRSDQAVRRDRGGEAVFWVFSLKHAAAEEVAKAVASRFNAQRDFKVMPDSGKNAVCVYCTQELQEKIGSEIRSLDSHAWQQSESQGQGLTRRSLLTTN
jgi:uncharacterized protein (TIGR03067 family)